MRKSFVLLLLLLFFTPSQAQSNKDVCHVYIVDVAAAKKAFENFKETGDEEKDRKALSAGVTTFPEFLPTVGEEELTTKHYPFPKSNLFITASVFYTDESLASPSEKYSVNDQSMIIGIAVSAKKLDSAIFSDELKSAITEVTYDEHTNVVRAKQYVRVNKRLYLIGIQCNCMEEKKQNKFI